MTGINRVFADEKPETDDAPEESAFSRKRL